MNAIILNKALNNFPLLINNAVSNFEETVIVNEKGSVVVVAQSEWNSIMETIKILKDKQSLKALIEGHNLRKRGAKQESKTIEEAFYQLNFK